LIPFIAGINRLPFVTFTIINSISAAVWVLLFINAGKYVGELLIMIEDSIKSNFWMILLILVSCIGMIYGIRRWRNRHASSKLID
jgi:membrane protein DedA with SNARE-associated domain